MDTRLDSGKQPPSWLRWFGNDAARAITAEEGQCPVGCHFFHDQENLIWEVSVFVATTEIVGGPMDGTSFTASLRLNISDVISLFDKVSQIFWQSDAVADDDELAQHVSFEGTARGHKIWLRVLNESPQGTGPGRLLHSQSGELETLW
jgi:hypothetical protein